jgi:hypothetical protein
MRARHRMISDRVLVRVLRSEQRARLFGPLVRIVVGSAVVAAIGLLLGFYVVLGRYMFERLHMNDFGKFYYSTQYFLAGQDMYAPQVLPRSSPSVPTSRASS